MVGDDLQILTIISPKSFTTILQQGLISEDHEPGRNIVVAIVIMIKKYSLTYIISLTIVSGYNILNLFVICFTLIANG